MNGWYRNLNRYRRNDNGGIKIKAYIGAATRKKWPRRLYSPLMIAWVMRHYSNHIEIVPNQKWWVNGPKSKTYTWQVNGNRFYI